MLNPALSSIAEHEFNMLSVLQGIKQEQKKYDVEGCKLGRITLTDDGDYGGCLYIDNDSSVMIVVEIQHLPREEQERILHDLPARLHGDACLV